jgi:hypothetical protein
MVADQFQRTTTDAPPKQVVFGVIGLAIMSDMAPPPISGSAGCKDADRPAVSPPPASISSARIGLSR